MTRSFQRLHLLLHFIVIHNFIQVFLVDITVIDRKGDTWLPEATGSANTMHVGFGICQGLILELGGRHVIVDDQLGFWNVDTTSDHVGCNEHVDLLVLELRHCLVTFLLGHFGEHDV